MQSLTVLLGAGSESRIPISSMLYAVLGAGEARSLAAQWRVGILVLAAGRFLAVLRGVDCGGGN